MQSLLLRNCYKILQNFIIHHSDTWRFPRRPFCKSTPLTDKHSLALLHHPPTLPHEILHILHKHLRLLHRRKMASPVLMLLAPDQIPRLSHPLHRHWTQLLGEPTIPHRLLDIPRRVIVKERRLRTEELAVRVDGTWEGFGEPVECDGGEDGFETGVLVGPDEELLANPGEEG